jgi:hypothetical protein
MLLNGQFILNQAAKLAERAAREPLELDPEFARQSALPQLARPVWHYGTGRLDEKANRVENFTALPHWTGSEYQGGPSLPDPDLGWAILNANGGHPDIASRSVVRRWISTADGVIQIHGTLSHQSENGDGVRGTLVSSRHGMIGQWEVANSSADTLVSSATVQAGDTIDFVTDCRETRTSDSFAWPVTLTIQIAGRPSQTVGSADHFNGPEASADNLPGQILRLWQLAYLRQPTDDEFALALQFVAKQFETFASLPAAVPQGKSRLHQAMTSLSQALLSSNEFLYVE